MLFVGVGLNSSWLLVREEVKLVVGLSRGEVAGCGGKSQVGALAGLEAGVMLR